MLFTLFDVVAIGDEVCGLIRRIKFFFTINLERSPPVTFRQAV